MKRVFFVGVWGCAVQVDAARKIQGSPTEEDMVYARRLPLCSQGGCTSVAGRGQRPTSLDTPVDHVKV